MKVTKLSIENVKGVRSIVIEPDENMVKIAGKNGAGKSSILDSIPFAICGKKAIDSKPLRDGESKGSIVLETEDLTIKRTFGEGGKTSLKVERKTGGKLLQGDLDGMFNALCVDPLKFCEMDERGRVDVVQSFFTVDALKDIESRRDAIKTLESERLFTGQQAERLPNIELPVKVERVSSVALSKELDQAVKVDYEIQDLTRKEVEFGSKLSSMREKVMALKSQIEEIKSEGVSMSAELKALPDKIQKLKSESKDPAGIRSQINCIEETNARATEWEELSRGVEQKKSLKSQYKDMTADIDKSRNDLSKTIAEHSKRLPVDGLRVDDNVVMVGTIPFSQMSSGEKLAISTKLGMAGNPELKVLLVKSGERLDEDNFKVLKELANKGGYQVWFEQVVESNDCLIVKDGELK
jgi:DNA repair exonuclease SbcCD ATPase subunit